MSIQRSERLLALDVLRGLTIAGMILVNNPGSWSHVYAPLRHAPFDGLTPTDLVFPFFMFIMGLSTYISLRKYEFRYSSAACTKILRRVVVIFCIGLLINLLAKSLFTHHLNFAEWRYMGVMQRLALAYGATALLGISVNHKYFPHLIVTVLLGYFIVLLAGNGFELSEQNIIAVTDAALLGVSHLYQGEGIPFDPEGLLSTIPAVCHTMIGFCCGRLLLSVSDHRAKVLRLFLVGTVLTFAGFLLSYGCPINKKIWSPTFVVVTCGLASSLLALLVWVIDIRKKQGWCTFFRSFGVNPLFIYVFAEVMGILLGISGASGFVYGRLLSPVLGELPASLAYALLYVGLCWCVAYVLYRKRVYIKI